MRAAARRAERAKLDKRIEDLLVEHDLPDADPIDGLLEVVRRTGAMMRVLGMLVGELDPDDTGFHHLHAEKPTPIDSIGTEVVIHPLVTEYGTWVDRHAKSCKLALDAGIDERRVRVAERQVSGLEQAVVKALERTEMPPAVRQAFVLNLADELRQLPEVAA